MKLKKKLKAGGAPLVVATAHTRAGLAEAARLRAFTRDPLIVEVRLDCLAKAGVEPGAFLSRMRAPVLLTARHPAEGGAGKYSTAARADMLLAQLAVASAVDVELRSATALREVMDEARRQGALRVVSSHDFNRTPSLAALRKKVAASRRAGADIVKIATHVRGARDLAVLMVLQSSCRHPLATMGMGPLGKVSRLALAAAGSRLNYGFLDREQVAGQWPAILLRGLLASILPRAGR